MRKRIFAAVLLLAMLLSVTSCGNGAGGETNTPSGAASQPTQGTGGSTSQPTGNAGTESSQPAEEPAETRYIFSDRPVAAYEVTGLDLKNVYDGTYTEADGSDYGPLPIARLTPGENSLILFCILAEDNPDYPKSASTVRSPDGSGQWEGMAYSWYSTYDYIIDPVPEGYTRLEREEYLHTEEADGGHYYSTLWLDWVMFTRLYHPDAAQDDSICVIDVTPQSYEEGFDTVDECLAELEKVLAGLGAGVTEIPVDEALDRCHVEIS